MLVGCEAGDLAGCAEMYASAEEGSVGVTCGERCSALRAPDVRADALR